MIRQARADEQRAVERCIRACGRFVHNYHDIRNRDTYYAAGNVWIAEKDGAIVGYAVVHPLQRERVASVYEFGVHPEYRRAGIGRQLLHECAAGRSLRLLVDEHNGAAVLFYLACGLRLTGTKLVKRHYRWKATETRWAWTLEGEPC